MRLLLKIQAEGSSQLDHLHGYCTWPKSVHNTINRTVTLSRKRFSIKAEAVHFFQVQLCSGLFSSVQFCSVQFSEFSTISSEIRNCQSLNQTNIQMFFMFFVFPFLKLNSSCIQILILDIRFWIFILILNYWSSNFTRPKREIHFSSKKWWWWWWW